MPPSRSLSQMGSAPTSSSLMVFAASARLVSGPTQRTEDVIISRIFIGIRLTPARFVRHQRVSRNSSGKCHYSHHRRPSRSAVESAPLGNPKRLPSGKANKGSPKDVRPRILTFVLGSEENRQG